MENELSFSDCLRILFILISIAVIVILIIANIDEISNMLEKTKIKNIEITTLNYSEIYNIVNNSNDISLQEKANFNKNYLLFGKKIIGYKVKDIIKEIEI